MESVKLLVIYTDGTDRVMEFSSWTEASNLLDNEGPLVADVKVLDIQGEE